MEKKIVIVGTGPTGLGAAHRLHELGHRNWEVYERNAYVGGLSTSFLDGDGFTWDLGGHILFSNCHRFKGIVDRVLGADYLEHSRHSWIHMLGKWIPYPFQKNLRHLPKEVLYECLVGLLRARAAENGQPQNFEEWILQTFGDGISRHFMFPYNRKVWTEPLYRLSKDWICDRVAVVDLEKLLRAIIFETDDFSWGPNNKFRFPLKGGTGEIFRRMASPFAHRIYYNKELQSVDVRTKTLRFSDGFTCTYDVIITTIPLTELIPMIHNVPERVAEAASELIWNKVMIVGVGFSRPTKSRKNWVYFPESFFPFYRVTYFSNYSPHNVPEPCGNFSLIGEISYPRDMHLSEKSVVKLTIDGLIHASLAVPGDRHLIKSIFVKKLAHAYPVPTIGRDRVLSLLHEYLEENSIYSRGRFGAWKYEIGNMDHSTMQGIEIVERLLMKLPERIWC